MTQMAVPVPTDPAAAAPALEALLSDYLRVHDELGALAGEHRRAVCAGDAALLASCVGRQNSLVSRVRELDRRRQAIAASMLGPGERPAAASTTLRELAQKLPGSGRDRVLDLASRLKDKVETIDRENRAIRGATRALLGHMDGLMQQIVRTTSRAGVYTPRGRIAAGGPVVCGVDLVR